MITIGSLFSGIGGFELGLERAIPNSKTTWQVEQNKYCHTILSKHWPDAKIYNDVRDITKDNVSPVDILCGGFPCQDISTAGKEGGIHAEKSGLWWEMLRIISELRPRVAVLENVPNIIRLGGLDVLGSLASIGYNAEWTIISARMFGAPHLRKRWFCVCYPAYPNSWRRDKTLHGRTSPTFCERRKIFEGRPQIQKSADSDSKRVSNLFTRSSTKRSKKTSPKRPLDTMDKNIRKIITHSTKSDGQKYTGHAGSMETERRSKHRSCQKTRFHVRDYWKKGTIESPLCNVDDGIPDRLARLKALGNAIVPQCSEWIGEQIVKSGLLEDE